MLKTVCVKPVLLSVRQENPSIHTRNAQPVIFLTVQSQHCVWTNSGRHLPRWSLLQSLCRGVLDAGPRSAAAEPDCVGYEKLRKVGSVCI